MRLFRRRKSMWERATEPFVGRVQGRTLARSGIAAVAGAISLTAASAVMSSLRRREEG